MILAGVSISLLLDENGIIKKSKDARREYGTSKTNEQEQMDNANDWIEEATGKVTLAKVPVGTKASKNGTINGKEGNSNNPTIPKNYIPIDTATSTWGDGSTAPSQDSVNHGLVIKDEKNNEWVWVPVPDVTVMCDTSNTTEYTLCGTTGDKAVTTNKYSKTITVGADSNKTTMTRTTPGTSTSGSYREPDITAKDNEETNYKKILGESGTQEKLAQVFVNEYDEMLESVSKYGGFYIGRYELSGTLEEPTEKSGTPITTETEWHDLYNACRNSKLQASDKVRTQMLWGCQWDVIMNWLINSGAKTSEEVNVDSSSWGNYWDTGGGIIQNTGSNEEWKVNNIYDLAGNCYDWTQESYDNQYRVFRGGSCGVKGTFSAAKRYSYDSTLFGRWL